MEMRKDASVEELLADLKNKTELMVDLAYSALLYESRPLAEEVVELEEAIDVAHVEVMDTALRTLETGSREAVLAVARLAVSMEMISDAARDIAEVVLRDVELHPVLRMSISDSDVGIVRVVISGRSDLAGRTLGDLRLSTETGMWIFAIKRGRRWLYGPDEDELIEEGDVLIGRGPHDSCKELPKIASGEIRL